MKNQTDDYIVKNVIKLPRGCSYTIVNKQSDLYRFIIDNNLEINFKKLNMNQSVGLIILYIIKFPKAKCQFKRFVKKIFELFADEINEKLKDEIIINFF